MKSTILAALGVALVSSTAALAADARDRRGDAGGLKEPVRVAEVTEYNWNGLYVSGGIGGGSTTIGADNGQGGIALGGIKGDLRVGLDVARGSILGGIFAQYGISDESLDFGSGGSVDQESEWMVGARLGFVSGPTLFYALGGYGQKSYAAGSFDEQADSWTLGGGIDHQVAKNFSLGLEYTHDWVEFDDQPTGIAVSDDTVKLRATYRINNSTFGW